MPVEMTYRKMSQGQGIINYFWKAKPVVGIGRPADQPTEETRWKALRIKWPSWEWAARRFGERWDMGVEDLLVEAAYEAFEDAGIEPKDIQAAWIGTVFSGLSAITLSPLGLQYIPMTQGGKHVRDRDRSPEGRNLRHSCRAPAT